MESLSAFVQSPLFSPISVALLGVITISFFWWRAGSIHSVLDRIWWLIAGKADVHDPVLKSLLKESRDIEKFQFIYRLKVETMAEIRTLASWMSKHGIGMTQLQRTRRWIDISSVEVVRQPPKRYVLVHLLFALFSMLAIVVIAVPLAVSQEAYLQARASKVWFKTDGATIKAPLNGWSFNQAQCLTTRDVVAKSTGFDTTETEAICSALKDDGLKVLVKQTVTVQRWSGIVGAVLALILVFFNLEAAGAAQEAQRLRTQLYPPDTHKRNVNGEKSIIASSDVRTAENCTP